MKRRKTRSNHMQIMRLWTRIDADKAGPYFRSIMASLRENWLDVLKTKRLLKLANPKRAPTNRQHMIDQEKQEGDLSRAETKFNDALEELTRIGVYLLEPVRGLALIPFRHTDDLAWYVFDLFAPTGLVGWRYHNDPMEEIRPLHLLDDPLLTDTPTPLAS